MSVISFEEFIKQEKKRLDGFEKWWISQNKEQPGYFPMEMNDGDWNEQLIMFDDGENNV